MKLIRYSILLVCAAVLLATAAPAFAQQSTGGDTPANIIRIYREEVKPGKAAAHEKVEAGWPRAFAKANWPVHYIAATSITGSNEAWFIERFESLAAIEMSNLAVQNTPLEAETNQLSHQDGDLLNNIRTILAVRQPDLSYSSAPVNIAQMRYFRVLTFRIRPGRESDFQEVVKIYAAAFKRAGLSGNWATYRVLAGMPGPTFLAFIPVKSLEDMDRGFAEMTAKNPFTPEEQSKMQQLSASGTISTEENIFAFNPKISYVSKEFAAGDMDFWFPKPKVAVKVAPAKKQTAGVQ